MSSVRKHEYMQGGAWKATQGGVVRMTKREEKEAIAEMTRAMQYLIDVVDLSKLEEGESVTFTLDKPKEESPVWVAVAGGVAIITSIVVGITAYLLFIF